MSFIHADIISFINKEIEFGGEGCRIKIRELYFRGVALGYF